eukprot:1471948-Pleurochrysis_carterae.AAC.2
MHISRRCMPLSLEAKATQIGLCIGFTARPQLRPRMHVSPFPAPGARIRPGRARRRRAPAAPRTAGRPPAAPATRRTATDTSADAASNLGKDGASMRVAGKDGFAIVC